MPLMTGSNWIQLRCISDNFRLRQLNEVTKKGQSRNCVNPHLTPRCSVTVFICLWPPAVEQDWTCLSMMLILRRNSAHSDHRPQAHADILLTSYEVDRCLLTKPRWPRKTSQTDWRLLCWGTVSNPTNISITQDFVKLYNSKIWISLHSARY